MQGPAVPPTNLIFRLEQLCAAFRGRLRGHLAAVGGARLLGVALMFFGGLLLLDWRLHLPTAARCILLAAYVGMLGATAWYTLFVPLRQRWSDPEVLAFLDSTVPASQGKLLDLYELVTAGERISEGHLAVGKHLVEAAIQELEPLIATVQPRVAFAPRPGFRWFVFAGLLAGLLTLAGLFLPHYLAIGSERLFNPFSQSRWPHRTTIVLQPPAAGWTVPQMEAFTLRADLAGEIPPRVTLAYRTADTNSWVREKLAVKDSGEPSISYTFPEVRSPIEFTLEGGDYQTDLQTIGIIERPYLRSIAGHYRYPAYTGLPDRTVAGGQLAGLEGTIVRLELEASMPLERAVLVLSQAGAEQRFDLARLSDTTFGHSLMLEKNGRYALELHERHGYREARPEAYEIRVTPDDPPEVELASPGKDLVETRQASVEVAFKARDKLGLAHVQFYYQLDEAPPVALSDRVTGPIPQTGTESVGRFTWDLRRMELPDAGTLKYFVRVQDNNPTGRGLVTTTPAQIRLVKPSEFHLDALERAKLLEEEARIAWRNQFQAWRLGEQWREKGSGGDTDPLWVSMEEAQQKALQAARQIKAHLGTLTEKYERNHMAQDFMAARLSVVAALLHTLLEKELSVIAEGLVQARPRSSADAGADRLQALRGAALQRFADRQKMAVLLLERILRKLYDWRDLQTSTVTTRLLAEQQEEVLGRTQQLAPKTIAKEIEDLSELDQEKLLTLGKQQRAIFDAETGLENQLTYLLYKAERQGRKSILSPLQAAFRNLRDHRVNDFLKSAAEMIANNQPAQILDHQKAAIRALQVVQAGLGLAGQQVEPEEPLTLAMVPSAETQFDPDLIKPLELAKQDPNKETKPPESLDPPTEVPTLPEGTDALSAAIRLSIELQDDVLARTRYLDRNRAVTEMPRFIRLKLLRLIERQDAVRAALDHALKVADKEKNVFLHQSLLGTRAEVEGLRKLFSAGLVHTTVQQIQADMGESLKGSLQLIALARAIEEATAENRRLGGVDAFGRPYLLRGNDLDLVVTLLTDLGQARHLLASVLRTQSRLQKYPAPDAPTRELEKFHQMGLVGVQQQVSDLLGHCPKHLAQLTSEAAARAKKAGLDNLPDPFRQKSPPAETLPKLDTTMQSLRDLLEERVRQETPVASAEKPAPATAEQVARLVSREHLLEKLKQDNRLRPEIRERMIRSLQRDFPAQYRQLLQAYYSSFLTSEEAKK